MLVKLTVVISVLASYLFVAPTAEAALAPKPGARCTVLGTPGDDVLRGSRRADVICGRGGDDRLVGLGGDDLLRGGPGADVLVGGSGDDVLVGGVGRDLLLARDRAGFRDHLACGPGRDRFSADRRDRVQPSCEPAGPEEHAPTSMLLTPAAVDENEPVDTAVGTVVVSDPDRGDTHDLELLTGDDEEAVPFRLQGATLVTTRRLDHEVTPAIDVRIRVTDSTGLTLEGEITVLVTDVDDPATAVHDVMTVREDSGAGPIDVLANDTDVDGGPRTIASVTQPAHGTVTITGDGAGLTYAPAPEHCGTGPAADEFTYTLAPGGSTATVRVDVTCDDDGPVAVGDAATVAEDAAATPVPVLANDTDVDGGSLSIASVTQPADGTVVVTGGGTGLTYTPDADACSVGGARDTFTYTLAGGGTAAVAMTVTCAPDAPVLGTSAGTTAYIEGDAPVAVDPALSLVDVDADGVITGATVKITDGHESGADVLALSGAHDGITATYAAGTLTLTGDAGPADYRDALRAITFTNLSDAPSTPDRLLVFQVTDDATLSHSGTITVSVTAVNDAPTLAPATGDATHAEGGAATDLAADLTVIDPDDTALASATVVISSGLQTGDELGFVDTPAVGGSYAAGTGTLTLSPTGASATADEFQEVLRTLTFSTANDDPTSSRTVEITVDDGDEESEVATRAVAITPTNDAPVIAATAGTVTVTEDDADGEVVDPTLALSDPDDSELESATVEITVGQQSTDALTFANQSDITGDWSSSTGVLALTGTATLEEYRAALRTVRFVSSGQDPDPAPRTVRFSAYDGDASATSAGRTVEVDPVNDAPVNSVPGDQGVDEDGTLTFGGATTISIADADAGSQDVRVTLTATHGTLTLGGTAGLDFGAGDGTGDVTMTFDGTVSEANAALDDTTYAPAQGYSGSASVEITTNDLGHSGGPAESDTDAIDVDVRRLNRAPVNQLPSARAVDEDTDLVLSGAAAIEITDSDAGSGTVDTALSVDHGQLVLAQTTDLTFLDGTGDNASVIRIEGSLVDINAALDGLTYRPDPDYSGADELEVTTHDQGRTGIGGDRSDSDTLAITVSAVNDAPTARAPASLTVAEDSTLTFSGGSVLVVGDNDAGADGVTAEVTVTHGVLTLGGTTDVSVTGDGTALVTVSGTVAAVNTALGGSIFASAPDHHGSATLTLDVSDGGHTGSGGEKTATDDTAITIEAVNDAPTVTAPASASVDQDGSRSFAGTVSVADIDVAGGDVLVTLHADHGAVTLSGTAGLVFADGDGVDDDLMSFSGALADVNAALNGLVYEPDASYHGADDLDIAIDDQGNTGFGGAQTATDSVAITVVEANSSPVNTVPGDQTLDEDTTETFAGTTKLAVSDADVDAAAGELEVDLGVDHGTLSLDGVDGLTFTVGDGTGDGDLRFRGSPDAINAALDGLSYRPDLDYHGSDELTMVTDDLGEAGPPGALSDTDTVGLTITSVNDAPVLTVPASVTADEDVAEAVTGLVVADADAGSDELEVSLAVGHGTLTLGTTTGLTFSTGDGTNDAAVVASGSRPDLNAALATLSYVGDEDYAGSDTLDVDVDDLGHTGSGGPLTDSEDVPVTVAAVNDAPELTVPVSLTVDEDVTEAVAGVSVADPDAGTDDLELSLAVGEGTLTLGTTIGLTFSTGDGTNDAEVVVEGTRAELNAALATLSYVGDEDYAGSDTLDVDVDDLGHTGSGGALTDSDDVAISVAAVNDAPVLTAPATLTLDEDDSEAVTGVSVSDVDAATSDLEMSLEVGHGTLTLGTTTGLTFTTGDGTSDAAMVAEGTRGELNAALATLSYAGADNYGGSDTLAIEVDDLGHTGSGGALSDSDDVAVTVTSVNDAPVLSAPATLDAEQDVAEPVIGVSIADVDAGADNLEISVSVDHGILTLGTTTGLVFTTGDGTNDAEIVAKGSRADLNAALADLSYRGGSGYAGADELAISVSDLGHTGSGGAQTDDADVAITVAPDNEAPALTVPLSLTLAEDASAAVGTVSVADTDAGAADLEVSLEVAHGSLTLGTTTGLVFITGDGTGDAEIVAEGTLVELNAALATIGYAGHANYAGPDTLTVAVTDDAGATDSDQVAVTVTPVNDAPSFTKGGDQNVENRTDDGDAVPYTVTSWATAVSAGPGESSQGVTFEVSNDSNALFTVQPSVSATGDLTFTTDPTQNGTATVTVRLKDDGGTADGGVDTSADQTFTITTGVPGPRIDAISPTTLVPGGTATLTGRRFSATPSSNAVTIGGVAATVDTASATQLTVTVPCASSGTGVPVEVTVSSVASNTVTHPLEVASVSSLDVGEAAFITDPADVGCNEIASAGGAASYVLSVYSASTSPSSNSPFQLSTDTPGDQPSVRAGRQAADALSGTPEGTDDADDLHASGEHEDHGAHADLMQLNRQQYKLLRAEFGTEGEPRQSRRLRAAVDLPLNRTFRVANINVANACNNYYVATGTRVYAEGKLVIYEDDATPAAFKAANNAEMAAYYEQIGDQFNADMEPIVRTNFGDILRRDSVTDNNGVLVAFSTPLLNNAFPGAAGFVVSCDQFPNDDTATPAVGGPYAGSGTNGASNFGEFFYMYQPVVDAEGYNSGNTPDNWYRTIRSTFIHESKHVASMAARTANNAPSLEVGWLEEGTARISEEIWGREVVYDMPWKGNNGYGSAADPRNIYCDVRPSGFPECDANPRGPVQVMNRHFSSLHTHLWGQNARLLSPFGPAPSDNASYYYAVAWSLIRYAIDRYGASDAAFLTGLTQSSTSGATNLAGQAGVPIDRLLGGWNLALAVDDYPGLVDPTGDVSMPTWNLRDIYQSYHADFGPQGPYPQPYPQVPSQNGFGSFTVSPTTTLRGGGSLFYQISGTQTAPQLLRLTGTLGNALPSTLRLAIVRVG